MKTYLVAVAGSLIIACAASGQELKNGDFKAGHAHWEGTGKAVVLDASQKPADEKAGGIPQLQFTLNKTTIQEAKQRFTVVGNTPGATKITVILKTSSDFVRNDKAPKFTRDLNWQTGGWYTWSALVYPNVDFCVRVDSDSHHYLPRTLKAGGDWQTLTGRFDSLGSSSSKVFSLVVPPGEGTIWVKSVTMEGI